MLTPQKDAHTDCTVLPAVTQAKQEIKDTADFTVLFKFSSSKYGAHILQVYNTITYHHHFNDQEVAELIYKLMLPFNVVSN